VIKVMVLWDVTPRTLTEGTNTLEAPSKMLVLLI